MIKIQSLTIADLVRGQKNVNLTNLAQQRNMLINGFRLHDGSSAKLLTNDNEIDALKKQVEKEQLKATLNSIKEKKCKYCGLNNYGDVKNCRGCGASLDN